MFGLKDAPNSAIALLTADHREVDTLFSEFEETETRAGRRDLAVRICNELTIHARLEEEMFYPELMATLELEDEDRTVATDLIWEAAIEHGTLEGLIGVIRALPESDPSFDAHLKVLRDYVRHHVKEEEREMFPKARASELDLEALGARMKARRITLRSEMGVTSSGRDSMSRGSQGDRPAADAQGSRRS